MQLSAGDVRQFLQDLPHDTPVFATTPHGSFLFVVDSAARVEGTDAGERVVLRLREVAQQ